MISAAALFAVTTLACHGGTDLTSPKGIRTQLVGTWEEPASFPGISYGFTLAVTDTVISGTGTFSIEAGASGTLAVTGVITGGRVQLDITRSIGYRQHFDGTLTALDVLAGDITLIPPSNVLCACDPSLVTFRRTSR